MFKSMDNLALLPNLSFLNHAMLRDISKTTKVKSSLSCSQGTLRKDLHRIVAIDKKHFPSL